MDEFTIVDIIFLFVLTISLKLIDSERKYTDETECHYYIQRRKKIFFIGLALMFQNQTTNIIFK